MIYYEQEQKKQIIPRQNDDVQTVMVMGFHEQEMELWLSM